jgi:hypothetical protein
MQSQPQIPENTAKLLEGFNALREAAEKRPDPVLPKPVALEALAHQFRTEVLPPSGPSLFDPEEARRQWQRYLSTQDQTQLERRAIRRLCWDPEIAATTEFLHLLEKYDRPLSAPMILGLLEAYHRLWRTQHSALERCVAKWLRDYQGYNQVLLHLAKVADEIVGQHAAALAAARYTANGKGNARTLLTQRGLALDTPYASAVAEAFLNLALRKLERTKGVQEIRFLCEELIPADRDLLPPETFTTAVKGVIKLASLNSSNPELRDVAKNFVLLEPRLGDPRRHPGRWDNNRLSPEAEIVKSWLSEEDLKFFFDLLMEGQEDRHNRRKFWLQYVHRVKNSRVAIGESDRQRLRLQLTELRKRGRTYASLEDWNASAFVMDFGSVIVVEFSQTNNSCSVHEAKTSQIDLQTDRFSKSRLKKRPYSPGWFIHDAGGSWMIKVQQYLAQFGVRD